MAIVIQKNLNRLIGRVLGNAPAPAAGNFPASRPVEHTHSQITGFWDVVYGKQTVSTMENRIVFGHPFLDEIGQQVVTEHGGRRCIFQAIFYEPCRFIAGITGQVALPQCGVPLVQKHRYMLQLALCKHCPALRDKVSGIVDIAAQCGRHCIL